MKRPTFKRGWQRWLAETDQKPVSLPKAPWDKDELKQEVKADAEQRT